MSTGDEAGAVREYVRDRDVACPGCGYNVRGLEGDACPECGRGLRVEIRAQGRTAGWWFGLFGLCGASGVMAVVVVTIAIMVTTGTWDEEPLAFVAAMLAIGGLASSALALSRWLTDVRRGAWAGAQAWVIGFGPLLALWGAMLLLMRVF